MPIVRAFLAVPGLLLLAPPGPALDGRALALRGEAMELVARDDQAALERAQALLDEAVRLEPRLFQARADRALDRFLLAAALRDEGNRLDGGAALVRQGRDLREAALDELRPLVRAHPADPAVVRALAVYYGLDGNAGQADRLVAQARATGTADAWIDFAELAGRAAADPAGSVPLLSAFAASRPAMLRARMMLAQALLDAGRREEGLAEIDGVLAVDPDHGGAKRLKAAVLSPPPARMQVVPAPADAPPRRPGGLLPRKLPRPRASAAAPDR